jgi:hypothetical protein
MGTAAHVRQLQIAKGDILGGRYRVERVLASGGMGVVLAATQIDLERRVAVKVLGPEVADKPEALERLGREARALSRLASPHVSRLLDMGTLDSGEPFLVMEYLDGRDLATILREGASIALPDAPARKSDASTTLLQPSSSKPSARNRRAAMGISVFGSVVLGALALVWSSGFTRAPAPIAMGFAEVREVPAVESAPPSVGATTTTSLPTAEAPPIDAPSRAASAVNAAGESKRPAPAHVTSPARSGANARVTPNVTEPDLGY